MQKKLLGHVGVDSGQLMVTDPCYVRQFVNNEFTTGDHEDIDTSYEKVDGWGTRIKKVEIEFFTDEDLIDDEEDDDAI
jgi:hypothetical protein